VVANVGRLRHLLFGISPEETSFTRRGFRGGDAGIRSRLEQVGCTFLEGYHAALEEEEPGALGLRLNEANVELRGFAFEGAAMGLSLLDYLMPWKRERLRAFLAGPGAHHAYMVHVGAGWALARLRRRVDRALERLDPLLGWLAVDGYGFHEGYFHWPCRVREKRVPGRLSGYALRAFDQGLGRSLWFVDGAEVARIPRTIADFPPARHADLWSGVGLACSYAGGMGRGAIESLRSEAGPYRDHLAQGAAFAAKARQRAGNPASHTDLACQVLWGRSAAEAAHVTDLALERLPPDRAIPAYEAWRQRIRDRYAEEVIPS
jgi:hypothetical protein